MTDEELFALDRAGFIPGPKESEKDFLDRVAQTKENFEKGDWIPASHWSWVRESLNEIFNVKPLYICAFYSNRSLAPWQAAASWIEGRELKAIQLREGLRKGAYLRLYSREEILAHEAVHAARSGFDEDCYEEFFAYMTSEKKWRRVLGPIVQRPWEVWPFLAFVLAGAIWPLAYLGATLWLGVGFGRLITQHLRLRRASEQVFDIVRDTRKTRAIVFRLTDDEIRAFSKREKMEEYAQQQSCLRWRVIKNYLKESYGTESCCCE
ncbi:MAG TPA: hypothetical protein VLF94_01675 [Chlamydiales bacterium]|nr:hypothetical protein [Chlamydiales bacterium]